MSKQINNLNKALAPNDAQKNSDITKAEIEAKLTGNITSHSHNTYATTSTTGTLSNLKTTEKGNLVGAINELFQNVDNGKQLIATAIDDSTITKDSTFQAMSNKVTEIKSNNFTDEQKAAVIQSINDIVDMFDYKIIE